MFPRDRDAPRWWWRVIYGAPLPALALLSACSSIALPNGQAPAAGPDPTYPTIVVNNIRAVFKLAPTEPIGISSPRWVEAITGWNWLVCARFADRGQQRTYALFIKDQAIVDGRYAVETDACGSQTYAPAAGTAAPGPGVAAVTGTTAIGAPAGALEPLH